MPTPIAREPSPLGGLVNSPFLEHADPGLISLLSGLTWIEDSIDDREGRVLDALLQMATTSSTDAPALISLSWVQDGIDSDAEVDNILLLRDLGTDGLAPAPLVMSLEWVQDGMDEVEYRALDQLASANKGLCHDDPSGDLVCPESARLISSILGLAWVQDGLDDDAEGKAIESLGLIAGADAGVALSLIPLAWVQDGLDQPMEVDAVGRLGTIAAQDARVASSLVSLEWVRDGIGDEVETDAIALLELIGEEDIELSSAFVSSGWVQDGLEEISEVRMIRELNLIADREARLLSYVIPLEWFQEEVGWWEFKALEVAGGIIRDVCSRDSNGGVACSERVSLASFLLSMHWVRDDMDDYGEVEAIEALGSFAVHDVTHGWSILSQRWVQDGMDLPESKVLHTLGRVYQDLCSDDPDEGQACSDITSLVSSVLLMDWVQDGINPTESRMTEELASIAALDVDLASSVLSLGWVQDGIDHEEVENIEEMVSIAVLDVDLAVSLLSTDWIQEGIDDYDETEALRKLRSIATRDVTLATSLVSLGWVQDGIDGAAEFRVVALLERARSKDARLAWSIVSLDWLKDGIGEDVFDNALVSLGYLADRNPDGFDRVMSHPALANGLTAEQAPVLVAMPGFSRYDSEVFDVLVDPSRVMAVQRSITLPLAGDTLLSIFRTASLPDNARSMDLLEHSVRTIESLMNTPFPINYVSLLYDNDVLGFAGVNFGTHIEILQEFDAGVSGSEFSVLVISHEVAHYYWSENVPWIDEGLSQIMVRLVERVRVGTPVATLGYRPCGEVHSISQLVALAPHPRDEEFQCNYLGEGLFLDLLGTLGQTEFLQRVRQLYDMSLVEPVGIDHVLEVFSTEDGRALSVIDLWYHGPKS